MLLIVMKTKTLLQAIRSGLAGVSPELSTELVEDESRFGVFQNIVTIRHTAGACVTITVQAHRGHAGIVGENRMKLPAPVSKAITEAAATFSKEMMG